MGRSWRWLIAAVIMALAVRATSTAQEPRLPPAADAFEQWMDLYVRDGFVYYGVLKSQRSILDRYVSSLADPQPATLPKNSQVAFWLNAYNALVMQTVVDHFPLASSDVYPHGSIRQIAGAFDRAPHQVAGRTLTLDQIENTVLAGFDEPRVFLAMGRGAVGSPRLRSELFTADRLEQQLAQAAAECADHANCLRIDRPGNRLLVSSVFYWRRAEFSAAYSAAADPLFQARSPIERGVLAFVGASLYNAERAFLERNTFKVEYIPFDWDINDMSNHSSRP